MLGKGLLQFLPPVALRLPDTEKPDGLLAVAGQNRGALQGEQHGAPAMPAWMSLRRPWRGARDVGRLA
jgi:hypothetical protein